jgi:hypothetical protein
MITTGFCIVPHLASVLSIGVMLDSHLPRANAMVRARQGYSVATRSQSAQRDDVAIWILVSDDDTTSED